MKKMFHVLSCLVLLFVRAISGTNEEDFPSVSNPMPTISFFPKELDSVMEEELRNISFEISWGNISDQNLDAEFRVIVLSKHPELLEIVDSFTPLCVRLREDPMNFTFTVKGIFLGFTKLIVSLTPAETSCAPDQDVVEFGEKSKNFELLASVIRRPLLLVDIVTGVFAVLVAFNFINMGVQLDIECIVKVLKKPIGPIIGFVCQFLFMPLAAYGISLLLIDEASLRLGLFTLGCSPGGSMSNFWTLLFDGDVNLSITMTFISTIAALGMMPLWIFTLGSSLSEDRNVTIPYGNLAGSLIILTLPIIIGLLIKKYSPRLTRISKRMIRPFTIIIVLVGISMASYVNRFVFYLFTWRIVVAGLSIAWGGYCFGALAAWAFRMDRAQIVAISIETAFQNPAVAFVLLLLSLPQPGADLSSVPIVAQLFLTGIPMWVILIVSRTYRKVKICFTQRRLSKVDKPQIDTVHRAYFAVETNAPEEKEDVALEERWTL